MNPWNGSPTEIPLLLLSIQFWDSTGIVCDALATHVEIYSACEKQPHNSG